MKQYMIMKKMIVVCIADVSCFMTVMTAWMRHSYYVVFIKQQNYLGYKLELE